MPDQIAPRPASIVAFERLYLASIAVALINFVAFWSVNRATVLAMPQMQQVPQLAGMVNGLLLASLVINIGFSVLFWWLVARARSVVGKWLVVVTEAIGVLLAIMPLLRLVRGAVTNVPATALALFATVLAVTAAAMLLRGDEQPWFREPEPARDEL